MDKNRIPKTSVTI